MPHTFQEPKEPKGYVNRKTAIGLTDPWRDHEMDNELPPKPDEKDDDDERQTSPSPNDEKRCIII